MIIRRRKQYQKMQGGVPVEKSKYNGSQDPQFSDPYLDQDEWRDKPLRHRYLHGGFHGTETRFCFYLPDPEVYTGRFFQYIPPFVGDEKEAQAQTGDLNMIHFSVSNGAVFVETNLGGVVNGGGDPTLMYRASASAAQYFRKIAAVLWRPPFLWLLLRRKRRCL